VSAVAWVGLGLGVANLVVWVGVVVAARRLWAKLSPWLGMLGLSAPAEGVVGRVRSYTDA